MRRTSIAFALSALLLACICSAQQTASTSQHTAPKAGNPANTTTLVGGPDTVVNCAQAQAGRIAMFTAATLSSVILCNSGIYEAQPYGSGAIGILNPNPIAALDVTGNINTSMTYQIGGSTVLNIGSPSDGNLFLGEGAGASDIPGQGGANMFSGLAAGHSNTTGSLNTFSGSDAGSSNTTGSNNTFSGFQAGVFNSTGSRNTFSGANTGFSNTTGGANTFSGADTGSSNTSGNFNTFSGVGAGLSNTSGSYNIFYGASAGLNNTSGLNDIYIGNQGPVAGTESSTMRIGDPALHTAAYIAGIYGATSSSGVQVYVNSSGQLGTSPSSLRFKEQVRDMGDSTNALMNLRPVTFFYKPEYDKGERTLQYGLIAEEVAKVYPELVAYDNDGQPYTVRYQYITTMLLNEVQKQYHRAEAEAKVISAQEQKIDELEQRLSRLERLIPQTVAQK